MWPHIFIPVMGLGLWTPCSSANKYLLTFIPHHSCKHNTHTHTHTHTHSLTHSPHIHPPCWCQSDLHKMHLRPCHSFASNHSSTFLVPVPYVCEFCNPYTRQGSSKSFSVLCFRLHLLSHLPSACPLPAPPPPITP